MASYFERFLERSLRAFMAGEPTTLARLAAVPLAVHVEDAFLLLQSFEAVVQALEVQRRYLRVRRITDVKLVETALELPRKDRFRAWVEYSYLRGEQVLPESSKVIYYGHRKGGQTLVEMVQYQTFAHPRLKRLIPASNRAG
ncbi:hypothetical protein [Frigidibacter sp. ROC022]|uniref:hypothetical protein n=1 Tax=Frigidibacter sp. ROC022 TaxID=2971796 RepID=UPI00215A4B39|nr:hypothetical protein [Frigidibacter sp. ROC022]MCR8723141.1 hypothetical protein [Frigidibacter sp. ROC022]